MFDDVIRLHHQTHKANQLGNYIVTRQFLTHFLYWMKSCLAQLTLYFQQKQIKHWEKEYIMFFKKDANSSTIDFICYHISNIEKVQKNIKNAIDRDTYQAYHQQHFPQ